MKKYFLFILAVVCASSILGITQVSAASLPTVTTGATAWIFTTGVDFQGSLTSTGGATTNVGFQYGTTTTYGSSITGGVFTAPSTYITARTGPSALTCGTLYHYRAFATNTAGTAFGSDSTFTTHPCVTGTAPLVTTDSYTPVTSSSYILRGTVTSDGGQPILKRGFQYNPIGGGTNDLLVSGSFGTGAYSVTVTGLMCGTTYRFAALAVNAINFSSGGYPGLNFTTPACPVPPTVHAVSATVAGTTATITGSLDTLGGGTATNVGFNFAGTPFIVTSLSSAPQTFTATQTVTCGTTYSFYVIADNTSTGGGVAVSNLTPISFTTPACPAVPPSVTTVSATSVTANSAVLNGNLTSLGSGSTTTIGFARGGTTVSAGTTTTTGAFSATTSGLLCGTTYSFNATANNSAGSDTGASLSFTTTACPVAPTVTTDTVTPLTTSAVLNGTIVSLGGSPSASVRGFTYNTTPTLALIGSDPGISASGSYGTGSYSLTVTGLTCGTTYHWRAYATTSYGDGVGIDKTFSTLACPSFAPTVTTLAATSVTANSAVLNGNLTSLGSGSTTTIGFARGTSTIAAGTTTSVGAFSATATGLTCGTSYTFNATASNTGGSATGTILTFSTTACPGGPTVLTNTVTGITATTATISGTTTTLGSGATSITGRTLTWSTGASTNTTVVTAVPSTVSIPLTGLSCATPYTVTASATNNLGLSGTGATLSFTTSACPVGAPTVTTNAASSITATSALLSGTVSAFGTGATSITSRGFTGSYGSPITISGVVTTVPNTFTSVATGLTCGTTYNFTAGVTNNAGVSGTGSSVTFTTSACTVTPPTVSTVSATGVTTTGAILNGILTALGTGTTTNVGFVFSGSALSAGTRTSPAAFTTTVSGLSCGNTYTFNATASNTGGSASGVTSSFSTPACPGAPLVTTLAPISGTISQVSAAVQGTITSFGSGSTRATMAFNYGTTMALGSTVSLGGTITSVPSTLNNTFLSLTCGTTYYYQASVTNNLGVTATGSILNFTTDSCTSVPVVTTTAATGVTTASATLNGNLVNDGGDPSTQVRFLYGTTTSYSFGTTYNTLGRLGAFNDMATGLSCGTLYHFAASAANMSGIVTGSDMTFTTPSCSVPVTPASVSTAAATAVSTTSATLNGILTATGGAPTTTTGYNYGLTTSYGYTLTFGSMSTTGSFASTASGLTCNTLYHFRAYATNTAGTSYGSDMTFTTSTCPAGLPTVVTNTASSITTSGATLNGSITATGGANATVVGFNYGTTTAYGVTTSSSGSYGVGSFNASVLGLTCNTLYHFRAYATNTAGTAYGSDTTFTTGACAAMVSTLTAGSSTQTTAQLRGSLIGLGGAGSGTAGFNYGLTTSYGSTLVFGTMTTTGGFNSTASGLVCNTLYHYQAYITTTAGTVNGLDMTVLTLPCNPSVASVSARLVSGTPSSANFVGALTGTGGLGITNNIGFEYGPTTSYGTRIAATTPGPTRTTTGTFSAVVTGLPTITIPPTSAAGSPTIMTAISCNVPWHMRAYAWNAGTSPTLIFGADIPFCN